jgi:hypothetical protein
MEDGGEAAGGLLRRTFEDIAIQNQSVMDETLIDGRGCALNEIPIRK